MTKKDFIAVIDRLVEVSYPEEREVILDFFLNNGRFFNPKFNRNYFYETYCKKMKEKGK